MVVSDKELRKKHVFTKVIDPAKVFKKPESIHIRDVTPGMNDSFLQTPVFYILPNKEEVQWNYLVSPAFEYRPPSNYLLGDSLFEEKKIVEALKFLDEEEKAERYICQGIRRYEPKSNNFSLSNQQDAVKNFIKALSNPDRERSEEEKNALFNKYGYNGYQAIASMYLSIFKESEKHRTSGKSESISGLDETHKLLFLERRKEKDKLEEEAKAIIDKYIENPAIFLMYINIFRETKSKMDILCVISKSKETDYDALMLYEKVVKLGGREKVIVILADQDKCREIWKHSKNRIAEANKLLQEQEMIFKDRIADLLKNLREARDTLTENNKLFSRKKGIGLVLSTINFDQKFKEWEEIDKSRKTVIANLRSEDRVLSHKFDLLEEKYEERIKYLKDIAEDLKYILKNSSDEKEEYLIKYSLNVLKEVGDALGIWTSSDNPKD